MITHTQVIVLKSIDYQESSKIITVLSEEHGRIAILVRGAKKPKSKFSGCIEPGYILDVVYYYKPNRSVQTLTEATVHTTFLGVLPSLERSALVYSTIEIAAQLIHEGEKNEALYELITNILIWLHNQEDIKLSVLIYIQIRAATTVGLNIDTDIQRVVNDQDYFFNVETGSLSFSSEDTMSFKLSVQQATFVWNVITSKNTRVLELDLKSSELKQLIRHLDVYFKYHIEGFKERKSDAIYEQLLS